MDYLGSKGNHAIRLDSVPRAVSLYERLGFRHEYRSLRYNGFSKARNVGRVRAMKTGDLDEVKKLDLECFVFDRGRVIERVHRDFPDLCFVAEESGEIRGYIMDKDGASSVRIGPWICKPADIQGAESLLQAVICARPGNAFWVGLPEGNRVSVEILENNGFTAGPSSYRMCYGRCNKVEDVSGVFGIGGPDKG